MQCSVTIRMFSGVARSSGLAGVYPLKPSAMSMSMHSFCIGFKRSVAAGMWMSAMYPRRIVSAKSVFLNTRTHETSNM